MQKQINLHIHSLMEDPAGLEKSKSLSWIEHRFIGPPPDARSLFFPVQRSQNIKPDGSGWGIPVGVGAS